MTLEEDFAELLDATLEEDFTLLLDFALELDFALTEEEDLAELLDTLVSSSLDCGVTSSILLDDSSSRGAKLLSSSPHAAKNAKTSAREILRLHFVEFTLSLSNGLRMTLSFMFLLQIISPKYNQNTLAHCKKCM